MAAVPATVDLHRPHEHPHQRQISTTARIAASEADARRVVARMANMSAYSDFEPSLRVSGYAAISPDGTRIAYADDASGQFNLVVQNIDGGKPQRVTSNVDSAISALFWHPDGESLIFLADTAGMENWQIYLTRLDKQEPVDLSKSPDVTFDLCSQSAPFSPDRRWLAHSAHDPEPPHQEVPGRDLATR